MFDSFKRICRTQINHFKNLTGSSVVQFTGALVDLRTKDEKKDDVQFGNIVASANLVVWKEKTQYRQYPVYNQNQSFMCGANSLAKALGIAYSTRFGAYVPFSRADIYQRRENKYLTGNANQGMSMYDMFRIASEGVTLEQLTDKTIYTDYDADSLLIENFKHKVGEVFAISGGVYLPIDMETIASVIQTTEKGVILLLWFTSEEYSRETPVILNPNLGLTDALALRHFITAKDFALINGSKCLICDDSAWFGGFKQRIISLNFLLKRVAQAGYPMSFKFAIGASDRPTFDGNTIISAQKCLRYEGLFPTNVDYFESVGPTTRKALGAFQKKYALAITQALDVPTENKLHQLYP